MRRERQLGRTTSASAALRRIVERQIGVGYSDLGWQPDLGRVPYRLQLGRATRATVIGLSLRHQVTVEYVLLQLLAAATEADDAAITERDPLA